MKLTITLNIGTATLGPRLDRLLEHAEYLLAAKVRDRKAASRTARADIETIAAWHKARGKEPPEWCARELARLAEDEG